MGKSVRLSIVALFALLLFPLFAFAQEAPPPPPPPPPPADQAPPPPPPAQNATPGSLDLESPDYDVKADVFYWATHLTTPNYSINPASFGGEINVRFKQDQPLFLKHIGLGIEYTQTVTGPRFVNTGGACVDAYKGFTGYEVPIGTGGCGLDSPGNFQFGGGKVKYFFTEAPEGLQAALYGDYFSSTGGRSAWGGGLELDYAFDRNWSINTFADYGNVTGNAFPTQDLLRYQADVQYRIPGAGGFYLLAGYRGYDYTGFYPTQLNGFTVGIGGHF